MPRMFEQAMEHLTQAMAKIIREEVEFPRGIFVTVLSAKMTKNQLNAKVVLSVMPADKQKEVRESLEEYDYEIKDALAHELRLRKIPRFFYGFDENEAYAAEIDATINELKKKGDL